MIGKGSLRKPLIPAKSKLFTMLAQQLRVRMRGGSDGAEHEHATDAADASMRRRKRGRGGRANAATRLGNTRDYNATPPAGRLTRRLPFLNF